MLCCIIVILINKTHSSYIQIHRIWYDENPHAMVANKTQKTDKVNVWVGIVGGNTIGPFFFLENVSGDSYMRMLQTKVVPALIEVGFPLYFQQDGAPPHWTTQVRQYLNDIFPERWIGRSGPIAWAPRSPDLTPLDFFLWGYLKHKVYQHRLVDVEDLMVIYKFYSLFHRNLSDLIHI